MSPGGPPVTSHPHTMMTSDEVDWLVYNYLQESGYVHTSFSLVHESSISNPLSTFNNETANGGGPIRKNNEMSSSSTTATGTVGGGSGGGVKNNITEVIVPPGHLVRILQKGLLYLEAEARYRGDPPEPSPRLVGYTIPNALPLPPLPKPHPPAPSLVPTPTPAPAPAPAVAPVAAAPTTKTDTATTATTQPPTPTVSSTNTTSQSHPSDTVSASTSVAKKIVPTEASAAAAEAAAAVVAAASSTSTSSLEAIPESKPLAVNVNGSSGQVTTSSTSSRPGTAGSNSTEKSSAPFGGAHPDKGKGKEKERGVVGVVVANGGAAKRKGGSDIEDAKEDGGKRPKTANADSNESKGLNSLAAAAKKKFGVVTNGMGIGVSLKKDKEKDDQSPSSTAVHEKEPTTTSHMVIKTRKERRNSIVSSSNLKPPSPPPPLPSTDSVDQAKSSRRGSDSNTTTQVAKAVKVESSSSAVDGAKQAVPATSAASSASSTSTPSASGPGALKVSPAEKERTRRRTPQPEKTPVEAAGNEVDKDGDVEMKAVTSESSSAHSKAETVPEGETQSKDASTEITPVPQSEGINGGKEDGTLHLTAKDPIVVRLHGHTMPKVQPCSWNPKVPAMLATGGGDSTCRIWDVPLFESDRTESLTIKENVVCKHSSAQRRADVAAVAWDPTGSLLATGSEDGIARIWTPSGDLHLVLSMHQRTIFSLKWNSLGTMLLTGSLDNSVCLWELSSGKVKQQWSTHSDSVLDVDWNDDSTFASASMDKSIHLFAVSRASPIHRFKGHRDEVNVVKFSPCSTLLASCSDDHTVRIWSLNNIPGLTVPEDEKNDSERKIDEEEFGGVLVLEGHENDVHTIAWGPQPNNEDGATSPRPRLIASASFDHTARLWNADTGDCLHVFKHHTDYVYSIAFSPGLGRYLATGSNDTRMNVWDVEDKTLLLEYEHAGPIYEIAWHPSSGKQLAVCGRTEEVACVGFAGGSSS